MKRIFTLAAVAVMAVSSLNVAAQNKFKGIVKYNLTSVGTTAIDIPAEQSTVDYKVMGSKVMQGDNALQDDRSVYNFMDLSNIIGALGSMDIELSYTGNGKIFLKHTYTQQQIDSLTIPCDEGYYVEYVTNETKKVAGYECKKAVVHMFDEEGTDNPMEVWYASEIGPAVNFVVLGVGINGMPLEFVQNAGDGRAIKLSASEVVKGKVKDVDFLMPAGFKEMSSEEFGALRDEIQEAIELMQD